MHAATAQIVLKHTMPNVGCNFLCGRNLAFSLCPVSAHLSLLRSPEAGDVRSSQAGLALALVALAICALCGIVVMSHQQGSSELMEVRLPNGRVADLVPVGMLRQNRMQQLFGPGDLPIPIEDDGLPGGMCLLSYFLLLFLLR